MPHRLNLSRNLFGPLCALGFLTSLAQPALSADRIEARYAIRLLGLPLGSASVSGAFDPTGYRIEASARLTGLAAVVSKARGVATASGDLSHDKVLPISYATTSANAQMTRTVRIGMAAGNVKGVDISPPFDDLPGRIPLTDEHKKSVLDPVSALLMPIRNGTGTVGPATCDRTIPVYDGWTRFNITLSYVGTREVVAKGFTGPVAVCAARYIPIAGHRPERESTKFMANNKNIEVWLAPVSNGVTIPYRISVATMVGTTVIEAVEFETSRDTRSVRADR